MKAINGQLQTRLTTGLTAVTLIAGLSTPLYADHPPQDAYIPAIDATDIEFRANHPLKVFVKVASGRRSNKNLGSQHTFHKMRYLLPAYVTLVESPAYADLIIKVRQTNYELDYRVIDTDRKDKKYKKSRRQTGGRCGYFQKAYYTKVKEKGEAYASYNVKLNLKGFGREHDKITLRSAENFSYGANLRASTNCGIRQTHHMPSKGVAKLFRQASQDYRYQVAHKIREEAAEDLGLFLAHNIKAKANHFYGGLAARLNTNIEAAPGNYYGSYSGGYKMREYDPRGSVRSRNKTHSQIPHHSGGYGR